MACPICGTLTADHRSPLCFLPGDARYKLLQFTGADAHNVFLAARDRTADELEAADLRLRWARAGIAQIGQFAADARRLRSALGPNADLTPVIEDLMQLETLMDQWLRVEQRLQRYFDDTLRGIPDRLKNQEEVTWETIVAGARRTQILADFLDRIEEVTAHIWKLRLRQFVNDFLERACGLREEIEAALKQKFRFEDPNMPRLNSRAILEMLCGNSVPGVLRMAAQNGRVLVTAGFHMSDTDPLPHCTVMIVDAQGKKVGNQWHVYVRQLPQGWSIHSCKTI
jgi:hypothetical protein